MGRRLQTYATDAVTVTYDPTRCIHAQECVRRLPLVFDVSRRRWVEPQAGEVEDVVRVVRHCPSGALQYTLPEGPREAGDALPGVHATLNGPYYVRGDVTITTEDGAIVAKGTRFALCRCGGSANKPFCDGSHRRNGFVG